jgi:NADPH:quinone reductase-like Zn-dependent oxidoreductase
MPRIVRFHQVGGPEVLHVEDLPSPTPKKGEVRIRVEAIGLNRAEIMFRSGHYLEQPKFPSSLGYEAAGIVEEVGPAVTGFSAGDRVSSIPSFSMVKYGTYGEVAVLPAYALANYPSQLSAIEGTSIWMQYLTAYGLIQFGKMRKGTHVLITAAASSVGLAAIQLANAVGAIPIATTRNKNKEESLKQAGAKYIINTSEADWVARVREATSGKGASLVFDPVVGPQLAQLAEAASEEATIFVYGALSPDPATLPLFAVIGKNLTIRGYTLFTIVKRASRLKRAKSWVVENLESGKLKPLIARTFKLAEIVEAHRYMESNEQIGKVVVTVP